MSEKTPTPEATEEHINKQRKKQPSMVWVTRMVLLISLIIFIWYLLADRRTPYTSQLAIIKETDNNGKL